MPRALVAGALALGKGVTVAAEGLATQGSVPGNGSSEGLVDQGSERGKSSSEGLVNNARSKTLHSPSCDRLPHTQPEHVAAAAALATRQDAGKQRRCSKCGQPGTMLGLVASSSIGGVEVRKLEAPTQHSATWQLQSNEPLVRGVSAAQVKNVARLAKLCALGSLLSN